MTGIVKRYIAARGFGFIRPDNSEDPSDEVFVHIRAMRAGVLETGVHVEYEVGKDKDNRTRAENVKVIAS